MIKRITKS